MRAYKIFLGFLIWIVADICFGAWIEQISACGDRPVGGFSSFEGGMLLGMVVTLGIPILLCTATLVCLLPFVIYNSTHPNVPLKPRRRRSV